LVWKTFAVPDQVGEAGETFGDVPKHGDDQRHQRRQEPALVAGVARIRAVAEPEAQLGQTLGRGAGRGVVHTV
jgi:hypothetical protein